MPEITEEKGFEKNNPLSENVSSTKTEQIKDLVKALAQQYQKASRVIPKTRNNPVLGGRDLKLYGDWLADAHAYFRKASLQELDQPLASEWVLDNYYIIRRALLQIEEDLPSGYYNRLPKLVDGPLQGLPRIYAIARAVLAFQNHLLNAIDLQATLVEVQETIPLSMGECWALPIFLRYSLIETLARALEWIIRPQPRPDLPVYLPLPSEVAEPFWATKTGTDDVFASGIVANVVLSFRAVSEQNWNEFFESISSLERILRQDPAGIYPLMDFTTRDSYRKEIEMLASASEKEENELAAALLSLARENGLGAKVSEGSIPETSQTEISFDDLSPHIGQYLLGKGRTTFEQRIGYRPDSWTAFNRWCTRYSNPLYLASILLLAGLFFTLATFFMHLPDLIQFGSVLEWIRFPVLSIALFVPILTVSASLVNWLVTLWVKPRVLPKMHFKDAVPEPFQTLVVIPALITSREEADDLARQIEMQFLRNPEPGLLFGLLTDFRDADSETLPDDEELVIYALAAIDRLNAKYQRPNPGRNKNGDGNTGDSTADGSAAIDHPAEQLIEEGAPLFYLLHRKRLWNQSEGKWMGWERKRGKLHELNLLLRGRQDLSFSTIRAGTPESAVLECTRFVITLDADTILPRGAARRLAGALAHPLNRARFEEKTDRVVAGYTVLQPRMEIHPRSANHSWFTRIYSGDTGLDLYTRAISDAYQDLFGEGSFVGKGIYDVDAFERSVHGRIPENSILSHDLLEGIMGRAALVTDITMIEDYPPNYFVQVKRQQRWIRGDWQLLPWLLQPGKFKVRFSAIDRWKILDNLLRAMLAPALLLIFLIGTISGPNMALFCIGVLLLSLGVPLLTGIVRGVIQVLRGEHIGATFSPLRWNLVRWFLAVAFLPYEAYNALDAILTTLYRLLISHRDLLQWTTAAQTAHLFGLQTHRHTAWLKMTASTVLSVIVVLAIQYIYQITESGVAPALAVAAPLLLLWMFSPIIASSISRPLIRRTIPLTLEQAGMFRQVARRTWGFFERFVGPEDHWLPPDHFQEDPVGIIAHHTSPSNIGLLLTSTLAAYDLGYLDQLGLATRLSTTLETMDQLVQFRGHFLNWYDTLTLQPLNPRYVSTVDSGNLAASLIVMAQACKNMPSERIFRWDLWQGYLDTLSNLTESLSGMRKPEFNRQVEEINQEIAKMRDDILGVRTKTNQWYALFQTASGPFWQDLSTRLLELVKVGRSAFDLETLRKLQEVAAQVERHHLAIRRTIGELVPWILCLEQIPELLTQPEYTALMDQLRSNLPFNPVLGQIQTYIVSGSATIAALRDQLKRALPGLSPNSGSPDSGQKDSGGPDSGSGQKALEWLDSLDEALVQAAANSESLLDKYNHIADRTEQMVKEMDFQFLYHPLRRVFHNGFNLDAGQLDNNYYDLLASEARIASIIALAKGEVPQSHWMQLSRPLTLVDASYVLLSWSATMFEYLMPPLFLRSYPGTLLADSSQGAVESQIAYGKSNNLPWGISESGYYRFDANKNYQYRAFGVPGLGFKRGLGDDMVVAPYASLMAIGYNPQAVAQNLDSLVKIDAFGVYGLYESIDFTSDRLPEGETSVVVREYMSHHQGMIMMALVNYFHKDIMVQRMHGDPRIQSVELLLQEQVPQGVPLQNPYAEDAKGIKRLTAAPVEITPLSVPLRTAIPQLNLLSNGEYGVMISNMGSGYSTWRGTDLTRWRADGVLDHWGTWIYIQDMDLLKKEDGLWSAGFQPIPAATDNTQVTFFAHMAVFRRSENEITSTLEVTVNPDDPVEIRHLHLHNTSAETRRLRTTSYGEVILASQAVDTRHPAFNKMFIESEFVEEFNLQIFSRRPRSAGESPIYLGHMLAVESKAGPRQNQPIVRHEEDRRRFIGRGQTLVKPGALVSAEYLEGTGGATLDPIFGLGHSVELDPHETIELAYLTIAGDSREAILALARRYSSWSLIRGTSHQANIASQTWLGKQHYDTIAFKNTLQVLSALVYPFKTVRAAEEIIGSNLLGQPGLWRFGVSGDYPILLVEIQDPKQIELVSEVLQVHAFLRSRAFLADVVIINLQRTEYGAELNGMVYRLISRVNSEQWLNQRGGLFVLYADQMNSDEMVLMRTACRFLFKGERGSMADQMPGYSIQVHHLPELVPTRTSEGATLSPEDELLPPNGPLQFPNGYGGFSQDGREYVIELVPGKFTPAPWVNVIGYPNFGFMVSETGSQSTWAVNSGENRLTPWSNDPVCDPTGEALYLRDEETGQVWTPTPLPAGADQPYRVRHGAGYSIFEHHSHGLRQHLTLFGSPEDPVKIILLRIENMWNSPRRITATQYVEWVLGTTHAASMAYIVPEYDTAEACLLATNPYNAEFGERTSFLIANKPVHGLTADRTEFLGRGGTLAFPAALRRIGLETRLSPGEDPCAVLQLHIDLLPGGVEEIYFVLGQGKNKEQALNIAKKYHEVGHVGAALERTHIFWDHLLETVQVHTPDLAIDLILNRWMLYQSLSCRIWGRSAFYQPSGAFGFRDQLQDILALLPIDPQISRGQILNAAQRQFMEGDVMHWWHPPSGRGVRTRISDDLLWLPYVTAVYVETTGDGSILEEEIPFLNAPPLHRDESERYDQFPSTKEVYSLLEHCHRAIRKGITSGPKGLPLIGSGDWNDGLNRVGIDGKGESVWLAWFLCDVLERFARICDQQGDGQTAKSYRDRSKTYAAAVEQSAWDGAWYRRAFYDDGSPLGSIQEPECQIDAIAQSWAVLSGAGTAERSQQAMHEVTERLVSEQDRLSLLFTPPLDKTAQDPGYIKGYLPGIRENGGQYTHAAVWTAWAFAMLGDGEQAGKLFNLLNPIYHSDTSEKADRYRVEPYILCADIYSQAPYLGRGGWTWYTGSAAWLYRLGLTALLGFKKTGDFLNIEPAIPPAWDGFEIHYQFGTTSYEVKVLNPNHLAHGVQSVKLDGKNLDPLAVPLVDDGEVHQVEVMMGNP